LLLLLLFRYRLSQGSFGYTFVELNQSPLFERKLMPKTSCILIIPQKLCEKFTLKLNCLHSHLNNTLLTASESIKRLRSKQFHIRVHLGDLGIHDKIILESLLERSRYSSVGIALGYGLNDRGSRFQFLAGAGNLSLHHRVQKGSGAHPAYPMGTRGSFPGVETAGA
jgi:hypothetical protein